MLERQNMLTSPAVGLTVPTNATTSSGHIGRRGKRKPPVGGHQETRTAQQRAPGERFAAPSHNVSSAINQCTRDDRTDASGPKPNCSRYSAVEWNEAIGECTNAARQEDPRASADALAGITS